MASHQVPEITPFERGGRPTNLFAGRLDTVFKFMLDNPGTSFLQATQLLDVDLGAFDPLEFAQTYTSLSDSLKTQVAADLDNLSAPLNAALRSADPALGAPAGNPGTPAAVVADAPTSAPPPATATSPGNNDANGRGNWSQFNDFSGGRYGTRMPTAQPQSDISRQLFGDVRTGYRDAVATTASTTQSTLLGNADASRSNWTQTLTAFVQRAFGGHAPQTQAPMQPSPLRTDAGQSAPQQAPAPIESGNDALRGLAPNPVPQTPVAAPAYQGNASTATIAVPEAPPQQASANAGQQTATFVQQAERNANDAPPPASYGRLDASTTGIARPQDPGAAVVMSDRATATQQQLPSQSPPPALTSLATTAQAATQASSTAQQTAGNNALVNPQTTAPNLVIPANTNPMAQPLPPPGNDAAAMQARDTSALLPAGHTVAGNMRRSLRSGVDVLNKPVNWMLALMPGRARQRLAGEEETTSAPWVYWSMTAAAYIALGFAIFSVATTGGGLLTAHSTPTRTAYGLIVAMVLIAAAWAIRYRNRAR